MQAKTFKQDFFSSIVVFLVAIPLCLGIALASNVPPELGLLGGIIGGMVIGSIGGCKLQVSGPAAGLVAIVVNIIQQHGLTGLAIATAIGGGLQILFGICKVGPLFQKIPKAVVMGMLAGIGIIIFLSQLITLGDMSPSGNTFENIKTLISLPQNMIHTAFFLGLATVALIVLVEVFNKKYSKQIPSALVAVLAATFFSLLMSPNISHLELPQDFLKSLGQYALFNQSIEISFTLVMQGVLIALIATTESLLSVNAVDQMTKGHSDYNREAIGQGVGNIISGSLGGLPLTGVIVRSSANVNAGGKTRIAAILHGVWILLFVSLFTELLYFIPVTALAAILVFTGLKLFNPLAIYQVFKNSKEDGLVVLTTMLSVVFIDLLSGVIIGLILYGILQFGQIKEKIHILASKNL